VTPRICVSIMPKNADEAKRLIGRAEEAGTDLIEVRLDNLQTTEDLGAMARHSRTPKIATKKLVANHGHFAGTETEQKKTLLAAAESGFQYVDIELQASNLKQFTTEVSGQGARVIVSFHDFNATPELSELNHILEQEIASGADVCKIVTTARRVEDNLSLLNFTAAASKRANVVCFAMGERGRVSRMLSPLFGGFFTFASLGRGVETAPGQMSIDEMRAAYKVLGV
jgi:3-dehydroquinate dehydratase type I